eukprot:3152327-Amphidinium_carterae.1
MQRERESEKRSQRRGNTSGGEREIDNLTHVPFTSWCEHHKRDRKSRASFICTAYFSENKVKLKRNCVPQKSQ